MLRSGGGRRRLRRWMLSGALALALAGMASASGATGDVPLLGSPPVAGAHHARRRHPRRPASPQSAQVAVAADAGMAPVPRSFLGFSTEYWTLPEWASQMPLLEHVLSLVHSPGQGPMILRVGGDSADHSFWDPREDRMPGWAFSLAPRWLGQAAQLVRTLHLRVILDLNLITDTPAQAAQWAQAAKAALPRGSIIAFEVGNEPDIYARADWLAITAGGQALGRPLPATLTAADYVHDFRAYARALDQAAPHVMLAGPALARPQVHAGWVGTLIAGARRSLGMVTVHRYPLSGCVGPRSRVAPTVSRLLSPAVAEGMATALRPVIDAAHDAGLALRLTELNSVDCGGRPGVSNTFATALWAPDALFQLLRVGVDGVNLHVRADTINAPFELTSAGLDARPLLYGLILFAHALGPDARTVRLSLHARSSLNLEAYAVRTGSTTLHVVLIDKGSRSVRVALQLPATSAATVQRLTAPSAGSRSGVTLGGRWLGADGRWRGAASTQTVARRSGVYAVAVRHASAALVTVPVTAGALGTAAQNPAPDGRPTPEGPDRPVT